MSKDPFFGIVAEAKIDALIIMTHRQYPNCNRAQVKEYLERLLNFCCEKDFGDSL